GHSCPHERRLRHAKTYATTVVVNPILAGGTGDADKSVRAPTPRSAVIASSPNAIRSAYLAQRKSNDSYQPTPYSSKRPRRAFEVLSAEYSVPSANITE